MTRRTRKAKAPRSEAPSPEVLTRQEPPGGDAVPILGRPRPAPAWVLCAPAGASLTAGRVVARGATLRVLRAAWLDAGRPRVGQVGGPGSNWAVLDGQSTAEGWAVALVAQTDLVVVDGVVWDRDEAELTGLAGMTATATGLVMATDCGGVV